MPVRALAACVAALVIAGLAATVTARDDRDPLAEAAELAADDTAFETATDAGVAFTRVSSLLEDAAEDCRVREGATDARCAAMFAGAGYARVSAVGILRCTRPDVFVGVENLRAYLDALTDRPAAAQEPPGVVICS